MQQECKLLTSAKLDGCVGTVILLALCALWTHCSRKWWVIFGGKSGPQLIFRKSAPQSGHFSAPKPFGGLFNDLYWSSLLRFFRIQSHDAQWEGISYLPQHLQHLIRQLSLPYHEYFSSPLSSSSEISWVSALIYSVWLYCFWACYLNSCLEVEWNSP